MSLDERIEADTSAQPHHARFVAQEQSDRPARRDSAAPVGGVSRTRRGGVSFGKTAAVRGACVNWDGKIANEGRGGIERTGSQKISDSLHESPERSLFRPQRSWLREDRSSSPLRKAGEEEEEEEGSSEASPMPPRMADTSKIRRVSKESDEGGYPPQHHQTFLTLDSAFDGDEDGDGQHHYAPAPADAAEVALSPRAIRQQPYPLDSTLSTLPFNPQDQAHNLDEATRNAEEAMVLATLRHAQLFSKLNKKQLGGIYKVAKRHVLPRYATIFREGASAAHFFVVLKGKLEHSTSNGQVWHMEVANDAQRGQLLGLEVFIGGNTADGHERVGKKRPSTVSALRDCIIIQIAVADLEVSDLARRPETSLHPLDLEMVHTRMFSEFVRDQLKGCRIFDGLADNVMNDLAPLFELEDHGYAGAPIFEEGDAGDKFYILLEGKVSIFVQGNLMATLQVDTKDNSEEAGLPFFGEFAILDGKPRMAATRTCTPCSFLVLPRKSFTDFLRTVADFTHRLRAYKELRQRQTELKLAIEADKDVRKDFDDPTEANKDRVNRLVKAASNLGN